MVKLTVLTSTQSFPGTVRRLDATTTFDVLLEYYWGLMNGEYLTPLALYVSFHPHLETVSFPNI